MRFFSINRLPVYTLLICLVSSCNQKPSNSTISSNEIDSVIVSPDTIIAEPPLQYDSFYETVRAFSEDYPHYKLAHGQLVDTLRDYTDHWMFGKIEKARKRLRASDRPYDKRKARTLPDSADYTAIEFIRQGAFYFGDKHHNEVVFEEWTLKNVHNAERWLVLLQDSLRSNDFTKPPRFQWVEETRLYMVSTRSYAKWLQVSDSLIMKLSGKTKRQMSNIYDPIDLVRFKKLQRSSHSSVANTKSYWYKESNGLHYSYFYFFEQGRRPEVKKSQENFVHQNDFHIVTSLHKPLMGKEKYESIKETLVQIQCAISEPDLNSLDLVNKTIEEVKESFGPPLLEKDSLVIFGHSNRIIAVKMNQEKVGAFKYIRLHKPFEEFTDHEGLTNSLFAQDVQ